jgi:signal transduction histidine kinase
MGGPGKTGIDRDAASGRLSPVAVDRLLAVVVTLVQLLNPQIGTGDAEQPSLLLGTAMLLLAFGQGVPLLWRRCRPVLVLVCIGTAWLIDQVLVTPTAPFGLWVALYSLIVYAPRRVAELGSATTIAGFAGLQLARVYAGGTPLQDALPLIIVTLLVVLIGFVVADRRSRTASLRERAAFLERERDALSRQAVAEERLRIARELHDLVAHSLSTIAIQSSTGRLALPDHPDVALGALEAIELSSRDATRELRQLLGVLRQGDGPAPGLVPSPGLSDLDALLDAMRSAGVDIRLGVDGAACPLPQGVDLVAYRVVQEALTNVVKHAATAVVDVAICYGDTEVVIEVSDDGGGGSGHPAEASGHGVVGMRERVSSVGGEFAAGPRPGGGFRVTARLPTSEEGR